MKHYAVLDVYKNDEIVAIDNPKILCGLIHCSRSTFYQAIRLDCLIHHQYKLRDATDEEEQMIADRENEERRQRRNEQQRRYYTENVDRKKPVIVKDEPKQRVPQSYRSSSARRFTKL